MPRKQKQEIPTISLPPDIDRLTPQQDEFLRSIEAGTRFSLFSAGRQHGKTTVGALAIPMNILLGRTKNGLGWVVCPVYSQTDTVKRKIESICRYKRDGGIIKKYYSHSHIFEFIDGYEVQLKTAEHHDNLRGSTLDWLWFDEAAFLDVEAYEAVLPVLATTKGPVWFTTTPQGQGNWVYGRIVEPALQGNKNYKIVTARSLDNPSITPEALAILGHGWSEEKKRQEFEAVWCHSMGQVYTQFNSTMVETPPDGIGGQVIGGLDPGANDPWVYLWVNKILGPNGPTYWVLDEYYAPDKEGATIAHHAKNIRGSKWEHRTKRRWADPAKKQERLDLTNTYGLENWQAKNDITAGIDAVKCAMEEGRFKISPTCVNTLREFQNYVYPSGGGDKPKPGNDHAMDALRYVIYSEKFLTDEGSGTYIPMNEGLIYKDFNEVMMPDGTVIPGSKSTPTSWGGLG